MMNTCQNIDTNKSTLTSIEHFSNPLRTHQNISYYFCSSLEPKIVWTAGRCMPPQLKLVTFQSQRNNLTSYQGLPFNNKYKIRKNILSWCNYKYLYVKMKEDVLFSYIQINYISGSSVSFPGIFNFFSSS